MHYDNESNILQLVLDVSAKILSGVHGTLKILDGVLPLGFGGITKLLINILDVVETIKVSGL